MIRRPPRSTLFPLHDALPISQRARSGAGCARSSARSAAGDRGAPQPARGGAARRGSSRRSEEHTSELSHANISYAVFCLKKKIIYNFFTVTYLLSSPLFSYSI